MGSDRNALCECQSGKKFKNCCAIARPRSSHRLATVAVVLFVGAAAWGLYGVTKRVFSDESTTIASRPPGPAPPGQEWSFEHGHWHDIKSPGMPQPDGPVPPGQVWSVEHGHWHNTDGSEPVAVEVIPDADISYSE